jgi:hypothetical protein
VLLLGENSIVQLDVIPETGPGDVSQHHITTQLKSEQ